MSLRVVRASVDQKERRKTATDRLEDAAFHPVQAARQHEDVIVQIVQAIRSGLYATGDKLPSERDLAERLDVSRQTIREAIRTLASHDILRVEQGRAGGAYVKTDTIPLHVTSRGRALDVNEIEEWLEAWRIMAPRVAQMAGMRASAQDLANLEAILDDMRAAVDDEGRFHLLEEKFQIAVARAAGNSLLLKWVETMLALNVNVPDFTLTETAVTPAWAVESLTRIVQAIARRDPQAIDRELDRHLRYLEQTWIQMSDRAPLRKLPEFLLPYDQRGTER